MLRAKIAERKADMTVKDFIKHNYRHFNAAVVVDASEATLSIWRAAERCS
jgi:hypothetical protein